MSAAERRQARIAAAVAEIERIEAEERQAADAAAANRLTEAERAAAEASGMSPAYFEAMRGVRNIAQYEALAERFPGGKQGPAS